MNSFNSLWCKTLQERGGWWEDIIVNRCSFPIAPRNTYSNIAYFIAGAIAFAFVSNLASAIFFLAMAFLAIGSALYHGTKRVWASQLDHAGMYSAFTSLTVYTLSPRHPLIGPVMALVALIVVWRLTYASKQKDLLNTIVGVFIAISTLAVALNGKLLYAGVGFGIFGVAYITWWMDRKRTYPLKKWGHAIFHLLSAEALLLLFLGVK